MLKRLSALGNLQSWMIIDDIVIDVSFCKGPGRAVERIAAAQSRLTLSRG